VNAQEIWGDNKEIVGRKPEEFHTREPNKEEQGYK